MIESGVCTYPACGGSGSSLHTPTGAMITVRGQVAGEQVQLSVQDERPEIAPADQKHIFERFARLTEQNATTLPGLGPGAGHLPRDGGDDASQPAVGGEREVPGKVPGR